jgi:hypothetical protein
VKLGKRAALVFEPLGGTPLHFFNDLDQSMVLRQDKQCMHMVRLTADDERGAFPLLKYACLVGEQFRAYIGCQAGSPVLGTVDEVDEV